MNNEMMDFTPQKNFDFFEYRYEPQALAKQTFLSDCQKVLESAHKTFLETLNLGARMAKLKASGAWKEVINPDTGMTFLYESFEAFSKYAFGFGKTRTSNLLSLSEFVELDEENDTVIFREAKYREMNMSQLIELAPLPEFKRQYFTSKIPVAEMRTCKKYIESNDFSQEKDEDDFDLRTNAKRWVEEQERKKEEDEEERICAEVKSEIEEARRKAHDAGIPFSDKPWGGEEDDFNPYVFDGSMTVEDYDKMHELLEADKVKNSDVGIFGLKKDCFSAREKVRRFLAKFSEWEEIECNQFFEKAYRFRFANGITLYASTCKTCVVADDLKDKEMVFFFLYVGAGRQPIKISKLKLEIWLKANERELIEEV